jgi:assimilatory nitrate reductase catalytic subunit
MGYGPAFSFKSPADVFREHAALSCFENDASRAFDIGGVASLSDLEYDCMPPTLWPIRADGGHPKRLFASGGYFTPDHKARFIAPELPALRSETSTEFPLVLNTGRIRDQWHTMTRTGDSPRLANHRREPFAEVHPLDAAKYRLSQNGYARVTSAFGACVLKVVVTATQQPGSVFVPIHWTDETSSSAAIGRLITPETDPFSGQPEMKATPVSVAPVSFAVQGFAIAKGGLSLPADTWWSRVPLDNGFGYLIASELSAGQWRVEAAKLFSPSAILTEYFDPQLDLYRVAAFVEGEMAGAVFVSRSGRASDASAFFGLGGLPKAGICACFDVSLSTVRDAMAGLSNPDVASIGRALRAGTKCGTCLPELRSIVARSECKDAPGSKRDRVAERV